VTLVRNKYIIEVLNEYEKLQEHAKNQQKQRQEEIYRKFPRIKYIDELIASTGFDIVTSIFKGINVESYIEEQKRKITDFKIEKAEILGANKYPIDYLEMKYKCSKCKDTGYIGTEKCSCLKQKLIDRYYQQSNLKEILKRENFDNFQINYYSNEMDKDQGLSPRKNMEEIVNYCIGYYQNFDASSESLLFSGSSGLGKTFLSNCIAKELLDMGKVVIYQTSSNLIEILRNLRFDDNSEKGKIDDILNCDLLVIDDLGTEPNTTYSHSELFNIINTRILTGKQMIISTNLLIEDLHNYYPERITSRIYGNFKIFEFFGDDIRLKKNISRPKARA
jgi:DNA replication protein DnaC